LSPCIALVGRSGIANAGDPRTELQMGKIIEAEVLGSIEGEVYREAEVIARKDGDRIRLYSRPGNDFTRRFPLIVEALTRLRSPPASSTARQCAAMTTACRASTESATGRERPRSRRAAERG
jgi:hypothetical protein